MTPALLTAALDRSPDGARSLLRRELLKPEYNEQDLLTRLVTWLERVLNSGLTAASTVPAVSTFVAMLLLCLLALTLTWLLSRVRRSASEGRTAGPVLTDERIGSGELRDRAETALAAGRTDDALVDGFRALAVRQVERGVLADAPGATAHEVAREVGRGVPALAARVDDAAALFDRVLYGGRPATREQVMWVLALDDELVGVR